MTDLIDAPASTAQPASADAPSHALPRFEPTAYPSATTTVTDGANDDTPPHGLAIPAPLETPTPVAPAPDLLPPPVAALSIQPAPTLAEPAPPVPTATAPTALATAPTTAPTDPPTTAPAGEPAPVVVADAPASAESTGLISGPSAILSPDPDMMPLAASVPALPPPTATPPPNTAAEALGATGKSPLAVDIFDVPTAKAKQRTGGARRIIGRLVLVGVLGAGGWFGAKYGPEAYDRYVLGDEAAGEPEAPLSFPTRVAEPPPVRHAEFTLTNVNGSPETTYGVTTDFETNVTRVAITREGAPDLEVLTFGESAFLRRTDARQWYEVDRGTFPLHDRLERVDWVRHVDELIPVDQRRTVEIERATESTVADVPTRRLLLRVDPAVLGSTSMPTVELDDLAADPTSAVPDPAADAAADTNTGVGAGAADPAPTAPSESLPARGAVGEPTEIEIWVDADGIVRQISGAPQLGADTITVVSTSPEPWVPAYPTPDQVLPLTASALIELGI